jgi:predicted Zn-dependent peptidase
MTTLPNGLRVVTATRPGTLSIGAWTGVGADGETEAQDGASHMIEHMMFKGTKSYAPGEIESIIENDLLGGLNAYTSKDRTAYYFYNMAAGDIEEVTNICGEMVFDATIPDEEYEGKTISLPDGSTMETKGERAVVLEEIKRSDDNVGNLLYNLMEKTAYPGQPHGRTVLGTAGSLLGMTAQDLRDYRDANYVPNNVVFAAVGPVEHQDFVDLITRKFGHLQPRAVTPLPPMQYQGGTTYQETPLARVCQLMLTAEGVAATDPDFAAYDVLGDILASGASSRLHAKLVDELELCNGAGPMVMGMRNGGTFGFATALPAANMRDAVAAIYAELRAVAVNVTQDELNRVINSNELALAKAGEANESSCRAYASEALVFGAPRTPQEIAAQLRQVTIADIKRVAAKILASNPTMAATVPPGTNPALLPTHAEIVAMRDGSGSAPQAVLLPPAPQV